MSAEKSLPDTQGSGVRFEPCAPFNSGIDIDAKCNVAMSWNTKNAQLNLSHAELRSTVSGDTFQYLYAIKDAISAHRFGDGFVLCVQQFNDLNTTACHCKYANYGFLEHGNINLRLMPKNLSKPLTWELEVLDLLASHSQTKMTGKMIGERWGIFKDRCDTILSLLFFKSLETALRESPLAIDGGTSAADFLIRILKRVLSGDLEIGTRPDIDFNLTTLVKAIVATYLLSPSKVRDSDLLVSVVSMCFIGKDSRPQIYDAATICSSNIIDAIPRRDICKLATLPNSVMGLGEINGTDRQVSMLNIVAAPYDELVATIGAKELERRYKELKDMMISYFERFLDGAFADLSIDIVLDKVEKLDFNDFCAWWESEVERRMPSKKIGTVKVKLSKSWKASDVMDCFALDVLAGSARLGEYLPIQVNISLMLGLETKILNPVLTPCVWYDKESQAAKLRVDGDSAGLNDIAGEAMVRPSPPKQRYPDLQNEINERTRSVAEEFVLVAWGRPKLIGVILILTFLLMVAQLILDRIPDDNVFSIGTRALTTFVGVSFVVITLLVRIFYNDWSLHDMWRGQRKVTDVGSMARELKNEFPDVVLALRNSGTWDRALSDTNAGLILRDRRKNGGVVMKRGLSLQELFSRGYLLSYSWSTVVIPKSDGSLEIFKRSEGGVYFYSSHAKGAVITSFGTHDSKVLPDAAVG